MGFFCEDIREEGDNIVTLVGLLPDNINVSAQEIFSKENAEAASLRSNRILGKLCYYARANFDPNFALPSIQFFVVLPDKTRIPAGEVASATIETAKKKALENTLPLAGVTVRAILGGFRFPKSGGLIKLEADVNGETKIVAVLNTTPVTKATSSTENQPPS